MTELEELSPSEREAVMRDDALLMRIGSGHLLGGSDELVRVLVGWRMVCLSDSVPQLVSLEEALSVIPAPPSRRCDGWRWIQRVAIGVIVVGVLLTLLSISTGLGG